MVRLAVVGLGAMGEHHVRVYSKLGCKLVGVADLDSGRATEIGERYKTRSYSNYRELIPQVDAVSIAVPTSLHKEVTLNFIRSGVHCLVEKPITSELEDAFEMIREARKTGIALMIGHVERFNPAVSKLKQVIDEGSLGKPMIISTRRFGPFALRIRDVGIIVDSATHDIDVIRYLIGKEPIGVFSKTGTLRYKREDHAIIVLDFETSIACIEVNWLTPYKVRSLIVTGDKGIARLDYVKQELEILNSQGAGALKIKKEEPLMLELKHFLECIETGRDPLVTGEEGLKVLEIALKAEGKIKSRVKW